MDRHNVTIMLQRWSTQTLGDFVTCSDNPANNRQVRMLGNYDAISANCHNLDIIPQDDIYAHLLSTAKENLKNMAFFGLAEYQKETQALFMKTFGIEQSGASELLQTTETHASCLGVTDAMQLRIRSLNTFDYELYVYAKDLFFQRLKAFRI